MTASWQKMESTWKQLASMWRQIQSFATPPSRVAEGDEKVSDKLSIAFGMVGTLHMIEGDCDRHGSSVVVWQYFNMRIFSNVKIKHSHLSLL